MSGMRNIAVRIELLPPEVEKLAGDLLGITSMAGIRLMDDEDAEIGWDELKKLAYQLWMKGWKK